MPALNEMIAKRLGEVARLLAEQGANPFRVEAYRHGDFGTPTQLALLETAA